MVALLRRCRSGRWLIYCIREQKIKKWIYLRGPQMHVNTYFSIYLRRKGYLSLYSIQRNTPALVRNMIDMICYLICCRITAALCTLNRTKCSRGTSLSEESNHVFQSDCPLRHSTVTKAESFEFFPVCFAEVLTAPLSYVVVPWI